LALLDTAEVAVIQGFLGDLLSVELLAREASSLTRGELCTGANVENPKAVGRMPILVSSCGWLSDS
jgi:hypothetical protein